MRVCGCDAVQQVRKGIIIVYRSEYEQIGNRFQSLDSLVRSFTSACEMMGRTIQLKGGTGRVMGTKIVKMLERLKRERLTEIIAICVVI